MASMLPWSADLAGRLDEHVIDSDLLRDNPMGDPSQRPLWIYTPPGYDAEPDRRYPSVYVLQGYFGHLTMWRNRDPFRQPFPEAADALFARREAPPVIVVYVDCWTGYGGSQFVDSPGTGRYHSYLCEEIVSFVDNRYRTLDAPAHRGISGHSSGGFGALVTPMLRPDLFGALASHAGDALYELCYIPAFGRAVRALREHDGDIWGWLEDFHSRVAFTREGDGLLAMLLGCAAAFSADGGTPVLPFDTTTGELRADVWQRWLDWDPVRMAPRHAESLRGLRAVWLDGGTRDEWFLELGALAMARVLRELGLPEQRLHVELFDGTHSPVGHRYPLALSWLAHHISP